MPSVRCYETSKVVIGVRIPQSNITATYSSNDTIPLGSIIRKMFPLSSPSVLVPILEGTANMRTLEPRLRRAPITLCSTRQLRETLAQSQSIVYKSTTLEHENIELILHSIYVLIQHKANILLKDA